MISKQNRLVIEEVAYLFILSAFYLLYQLGSGSLAGWDEALYAQVARELLSSSNWLDLTWQGSLWFDKPPLAIWVTAFFYKIFGVTEFAARLFSALCGIGTILVTYFLGKELFNRWTGFLGAIVLLSSMHYFRMVRFGMLDGPLVFFMSLALLFFWIGCEKKQFLIWSGVCLGLGFMVKGYAAVLMVPITWVFCFWAGRTDVLKSREYWFGILAALAILLPWHIYQTVKYQEAFFKDVIWKHLFNRTSQALDGHVGNYYFYIRTMVNKYHPWVLVAVISGPFFLWKAIRERSESMVFVTSWMYVIFLFITFIKTKLAWYIMPLYPALSISVGYLLVKIFNESYRRQTLVLFFLLMPLHIPFSHIFSQDYARDIKGLSAEVQRVTPADERVYLYNWHDACAAAFYFQRKISYLDSLPELDTELAKTNRIYLVGHEPEKTELKNQFAKRGFKPVSEYENGIFWTEGTVS